MRLSDLISQRIVELLAQSETGVTEIKRNELASMLGCVPSQINYVLSSRFTPQNGYIVESRRGGGGYIKITKVRFDTSNILMHIINSIGNDISANSSRIILEHLLADGVLTEQQAILITSAISDKCYAEVPPIMRDRLRAEIFKNMLAACV